MTYGQYITQLYYTIYLVLVGIVTFVYVKKYALKTANNNDNNEELGSRGKSIPIVLFAIFLSLFIGFRPEHGFGDSSMYREYYYFLEGSKFVFDFHAENIIWDNLFSWWASNGLGISRLFVLVATCYFTLTLLACTKLFPRDYPIAYLTFLGALSTFSYGVNGIKAGLAATLFILALAYRKNLKLCVLLILLSWGTHHSMQLPVGSFVLTLFFKDPKWYFRGWFFCLLMAILRVSYFQNIFASISDETGSNYLTADSDIAYVTGVRLDFILYSAMPVWIGYIAVYRKKIKISKIYMCLLNMYLCTNGVWMLCMYASFTNRIAYLSWFLYPIVLIYPFLSENWGTKRYRTVSKVVLLHLAFSLFMFFVIKH